MKLHLGCGGIYLDGYRNIDLPPDQHGIQSGIRPDEFADITRLAYDDGSIEEVRLHHVFEHFSRATALRLLIDWYSWLAPGGVLRLETPDFKRCARAFFLRRSPERQAKLLRHLFGSHEAAWAVHWDGWYREKFELYLTRLGYTDLRFERSRWHGIYNITVHARAGAPIPRAELERRGEDLLRYSLVDSAESELAMLDVWIEEMKASRTAGTPPR